MSLNKRKCREFANPGLSMNLSNGLFHADQIAYVVRTAVKIIDHHRTLILYVYSSEQVAHGDARPCMTVFQNRNDFITLAMNEDGSTKWRTAAFDNLGKNWSFARECAFYSVRDEERVSSYFKNSTGTGFRPLVKEQFKIQEKRRMERQRIKERRIISRMSCVRSLPRGLKGWINKSVMPAYLFYKKGGNNVPGICSCCGKEIVLQGVKQGVKKICPHCRKELICKPRSRRGRYMHDRDTVQVIQNTGDGGLVVRIVKVYYCYKGDTPDIQIYENARHFIYQDVDGEIHTESYYDSHGGILTTWENGTRPTFFAYQYNFGSDDCGHLFTKNLPDALAGTPWQYCPIDRFYSHFHEPMQALPFLSAHLEHPSLEHLVKVGFYSIVSDLAYRHSGGCLDESKNRTHQILQVATEDVQFLRDMDADLRTLQIFQEYTRLKGRQELLLWQLEHKVKNDIIPILQHITAHKFMRYLDNQYEFLQLRRTPHGGQRYENMQALVSEYRDYLEMCSDLEYDMKNSFVLYPKDLQKSHDRTAKRYKHRSEAIIKKKFIAAYQRIAGQLDYEKDGMKIVYPKTPNDVVAEAHSLHHCVDSYVSRVAKGECFILFLRKCASESRPFYTIEIRDQKIAQVRGMKNCSVTPEVEEFIKAWEKRVLSRIDVAA